MCSAIFIVREFVSRALWPPGVIRQCVIKEAITLCENTLMSLVFYTRVVHYKDKNEKGLSTILHVLTV